MDQISVGLSKTHPKLFKMVFDLMGFSEKHMPKAYFKALMKEVGETDQKIAEDDLAISCLIFFSLCIQSSSRQLNIIVS